MMKWTSAFSYLPINYKVSLANIKDRTQRVIFDNNLNGNRIRLRFSNKYSTKPLTLACVTVGIVREGKVQDVVTVCQNQAAAIELDAGEECWSDELEYPVEAGEKIAVSIYIKEQQEIGSVCIFWAQNGAGVSISESGNYTSGESFDGRPMEEVYQIVREDANKGTVFYGFTGLQVLTDDSVKTVAAFGDSITHMSYVTNALCRRLYSAYPGQVVLLNRGIGGNRVLHDAASVDFICFGDAGVKRFEKDVFGEESADVVLVLEGINDIMHPIQLGYPHEQITSDELVEGYKQYIEIAHRHHAVIFGATITPCGNEEYPQGWLPVFEEIRLKTNDWIREGKGYDGYFDYDEAVRDASRHGYMKEGYHIGDGLHPNDAGGAAMAAQVDLEKIMGRGK